MINRAEVDAKSAAVEIQGQLLVRNLSRQCDEAVPMPVIAGVVGAPVNGIARAVVPQDETFLEKTKGSLLSPALRLKNETLLQFCGRTELSLHEIRTLPRKELERRIKVRAENREQEYVFEPKRPAKLIPHHLRVTFAAEGNLDAHLRPRMPANVIDTEDLASLWDAVNQARQG